jgi:hypothetical protein
MAKQPMNPLAGAAGPGMYSTRTDNLNFQSTEYGSGIENAANLAGGPLAKTPDVRATSRSEMGMAPSQITPLYAPSERADEPITAGIAMGEGPGPEALGMNQPSVDTDADRQRMLSYLPALETIAQSPSSSQSFRNYVRLLRANLL